jgi:hypothetical protein
MQQQREAVFFIWSSRAYIRKANRTYWELALQVAGVSKTGTIK